MEILKFEPWEQRDIAVDLGVVPPPMPPVLDIEELIDGMNAGGRATQLLRPPANETIQVTF